MLSRVLNLSDNPAIAPAGDGATRRDPDLVLAFLPSGDGFSVGVRRLAQLWPNSTRVGCESDQLMDGRHRRTDVAGSGPAAHRSRSDGVAHLFWFERPNTQALVTLIEGSLERPPSSVEIARLAERLGDATAVLALCDGFQFPLTQLISGLSDVLGDSLPVISGGRASAVEPGAGEARIFVGDVVLSAACLVLTFRNLDIDVEVMQTWEAASPIYRVTRAEGAELLEIDGVPALNWYGRLFRMPDGAMAPLSEESHRFPLMLVGPSESRRGLYRSLKQLQPGLDGLTLWGDICRGDLIRVGVPRYRNTPAYIERLMAGRTADATLVFASVGRRLALRDEITEELELLNAVLDNKPLSGCYTFGELGPTATAAVMLHNHVTVVCLLRERM